MGWRDPYVNIGTSANDYVTDAFGRAYTGAASGQVRSAGPDGVSGNADDIVYPAAPTIMGVVTATVKTITGGKTLVDPAGYRVDLFYANGGVDAALADTAAPFSFSNVPMGVHAVRVIRTVNPQAGTVVAPDLSSSGPRARRPPSSGSDCLAHLHIPRSDGPAHLPARSDGDGRGDAGTGRGALGRLRGPGRRPPRHSD